MYIQGKSLLFKQLVWLVQSGDTNTKGRLIFIFLFVCCCCLLFVCFYLLPVYLQPPCRQMTAGKISFLLTQQNGMKNLYASDPEEVLERGECSGPHDFVISSSSTSRDNADRQRKQNHAETSVWASYPLLNPPPDL